MAICVECIYYDHDENQLVCDNEDLPITDFVRGVRHCVVLNPKGECKGFKRKGERESIYESKAMRIWPGHNEAKHSRKHN